MKILNLQVDYFILQSLEHLMEWKILKAFSHRAPFEIEIGENPQVEICVKIKFIN